MTEADFEQALRCVLLEHKDTLADALAELTGDDNAPQLDGVSTFERVGLLTSNKGLVLRMTDGTEVQLTIVAR